MTKPEITGGPAYPISRAHFAQAGEMLSSDWVSGMTLLDYFAGQALASLDAATCVAMLEQAQARQITPEHSMALYCYDIAEAMIAEKRRREAGTQ